MKRCYQTLVFRRTQLRLFSDRCMYNDPCSSGIGVVSPSRSRPTSPRLISTVVRQQPQPIPFHAVKRLERSLFCHQYYYYYYYHYHHFDTLQHSSIQIHSCQRYSITCSLPNPAALDDRQENDNNRICNNDNHSNIDILEALRSVPPGSLTFRDIRMAEKALETWAGERRPTVDIFETARFILQRLLQEQDYFSEDENFAAATAAGDDGHYHDASSNSNNKFYQVRPFLLNRVLDCWRRGWRNGKLNDQIPTDIIAWVDQLEASYGLMADSRGLTLIIDGICLRGNQNEAPLLAQWLLDRRMEQVHDIEYYVTEEDNTHEDIDSAGDVSTTLRPDTILFSNVIRAWAKSDRMEAPEMADGLLETMMNLYNNGWKDSGPTTRTYGVTMEAWHNSRRPEAAERIVAHLNDMKYSPLEQVDPDRVCYQYAINALVGSNTEEGMEQADQLLQEMVALYEAGNNNVAPNAANFARVMMGYARHGNVERTESVLEQLQDLFASTGDPDFRPTDECLKAMVIAKSKSGSPVEAQGLLDELTDQALSSGNTSLMPSRGYFVDTLVGWTKHRDPVVAARNSHEVLKRMLELGNHPELRHLLPDAKSFETVILTWSRSRQNNAPNQIQNLMEDMEKLKLKHNLRMYTNMMLAWQRTGRKDRSDQIRHILAMLKGRCSSGEGHLCPDKFTYGIVIDTIRQENGSFDEIELLFEEMMGSWKSGNPNAKPDTHVFHNILSACFRLPEGMAVEKCEKYIHHMRDLGYPMTAVAYGYWIQAVSKKGDVSDSLTRASMLLEEALEANRKGLIERPSPKDYRLFLQLVANSKLPQQRHQAQQLLEKLPKHHRTEVPRELMPPLLL